MQFGLCVFTNLSGGSLAMTTCDQRGDSHFFPLLRSWAPCHCAQMHAGMVMRSHIQSQGHEVTEPIQK